MLKYTILYKNGKTWNGKANNLADVPVHNDAVLLVAKNSAGSIIYMIGQYGGWSSVPTTFRRAKRRTPNPNSKTKKQKAFDQAYLEWTMEHFAKYDNCPSVKEYKKWLWEQKNEKVVKVDKDGFIPWNGGEMPVPKGAMVHVKLRSGKEVICTAGYLKQIQDIDSFLKPHYNSIIKEELSPQLEYVDSSIKIENGVAVLKLKTRYIGPAIETATIQVTIDYDK